MWWSARRFMLLSDVLKGHQSCRTKLCRYSSLYVVFITNRECGCAQVIRVVASVCLEYSNKFIFGMQVHLHNSYVKFEHAYEGHSSRQGHSHSHSITLAYNGRLSRQVARPTRSRTYSGRLWCGPGVAVVAQQKEYVRVSCSRVICRLVTLYTN